MGQDLRQVIRGELIFLASLGLFLVAVLMPVSLVPLLIVPWLICIFSSFPTLVYGGWVMVINGALTGLKRQPGRVAGAGVLLAIWGILLIMLGGLVLAILCPYAFGPLVSSPFNQPILMGFIMYGLGQIGLGLILVALTAPSYLESLARRFK